MCVVVNEFDILCISLILIVRMHIQVQSTLYYYNNMKILSLHCSSYILYYDYDNVLYFAIIYVCNYGIDIQIKLYASLIRI